MKVFYMKFLLIICLVSSISTFSQEKFTLSGTIKDAETSETLIGATVMLKAGLGGATDLDGNFSIKAEPGTYEVVISFVGYDTQKQKVKLNKDLKLDIKMSSKTLDEVEIVADVAKIRETPVAFSNISQTKINEELAGKDISMMVNSTPGAYATEQGGGSGDSRVTLRGFDQRNIGVLVDGIPVNDMENGQVFWSNWDGLSEITRTMQVQRGLGASKLAISSVGGTMNIITKGIDAKKSFVVKKDWGNNNYQRIGLAYTSGFIKNKFGVTLAGSYKTGDGWVDQTWTKAWSYFA
ncbi:MAG: carboxypeptidase-like regulatory domain-containing protein [Bacteroidetes bacterium]|nr:carboxypeptidase-like regulatory domain-containing protein [Bacteroidota bacterium]